MTDTSKEAVVRLAAELDQMEALHRTGFPPERRGTADHFGKAAMILRALAQRCADLEALNETLLERSESVWPKWAETILNTLKDFGYRFDDLIDLPEEVENFLNGYPDSSTCCLLEQRDDAIARAERAEVERDAIAAAMVEAAADILDTHGDNTATEALGQRLCCNGQMCGCRGASVGEYLQHLIRALTPADALAKLDQIRAEERAAGMRDGMQEAADLFPAGSRDGGLISATILAAMEKEQGQ